MPISLSSASAISHNQSLNTSVNVRFFNNTREDGEYDFERRFSFFSDVPGETQLVGSALDTALDEIYERITQDVFNASLARW